MLSWMAKSLCLPLKSCLTSSGETKFFCSGSASIAAQLAVRAMVSICMYVHSGLFIVQLRGLLPSLTCQSLPYLPTGKAGIGRSVCNFYSDNQRLAVCAADVEFCRHELAGHDENG